MFLHPRCTRRRVVQNAIPGRAPRGDNPRGRERRGASERARADNRKGYMAHIMRGGGRRREGGISLAAFQKPHSQCLLHSKYLLSHQATTAYYTGIPAYSDTVCNMASATLLLSHHDRVLLKAGTSFKVCLEEEDHHSTLLWLLNLVLPPPPQITGKTSHHSNPPLS